MQQRRTGYDDNAVFHLRQRCDNAKALGNDVLVWRKTVVGQRFPFDEVRYEQIGIGKIADFGFQLVGLPRVVRHYNQRLLQGACEFCGGQRCAGANQPANRRDLIGSIGKSRIDE